MISHRLRCIFIHIPKCAGTSVETALRTIDGEMASDSRDHRTVRMLEPLALLPLLGDSRNQQQLIRRVQYGLRHRANETLTRKQYSDYFKFAIVRNPWTRAFSLYMNVVRDKSHWPKFAIDSNTTLAEFLRPNIGRRMLRSQLEWITNWRGEVPLDFICRFENLDEDFDTVCRVLGCGPIELPFRNMSRDPPQVPYSEPEFDRLIRNHYAREIEYFGFTPPAS